MQRGHMVGLPKCISSCFFSVHRHRSRTFGSAGGKPTLAANRPVNLLPLNPQRIRATLDFDTHGDQLLSRKRIEQVGDRSLLHGHTSSSGTGARERRQPIAAKRAHAPNHPRLRAYARSWVPSTTRGPSVTDERLVLSVGKAKPLLK